MGTTYSVSSILYTAVSVTFTEVRLWLVGLPYRVRDSEYISEAPVKDKCVALSHTFCRLTKDTSCSEVFYGKQSTLQLGTKRRHRLFLIPHVLPCSRTHGQA